MACSKPTLKQNLEEGLERQKKIVELMDLWYKEATGGMKPLQPTDPAVLSFQTHCEYYYTVDTQNKLNLTTQVSNGLNLAIQGLPGVTIDASAIVNIVASALGNTTKDETSQGYSSCVSKAYPGKYASKDCLYKPIVVIVSFNFSSSEYETEQNVAAFGCWVYLVCTKPPIPPAYPGGPLQYTSIHDGKPLPNDIPDDIEIVGKEYMTLQELDDFQPDS